MVFTRMAFLDLIYFCRKTSQTADTLYRNNQLEFKEKVKECVKYTQDHLYDPSPVDDKHYITFEKYIPSIHDSVRATMMTQSHEERIRASGYSWVSPGSFKPLSK
ncbi:sodium/potassium/calcium exchanger [Holotrichia oblita]|uniref:Sodium/potassium/calcium exchanger n=1 Tax=Holotrichia oblita TaxID=644536 RepID=A0ACB9THZ4_HOLOL|nr:sodium/potassium/calcium exchanger [Holotrichia oblita]